MFTKKSNVDTLVLLASERGAFSHLGISFHIVAISINSFEFSIKFASLIRSEAVIEAIQEGSALSRSHSPGPVNVRNPISATM